MIKPNLYGVRFRRGGKTWRNKVISRENGVTTLAIYHREKLKGIMLSDTSLDEDILDATWRIGTGGYAITNFWDVPTEMHRIFFAAPYPLVCDHLNRNPLDNRKENIRHVTQRVNRFNTDISDIVSARPPHVYTKRRWGQGSISVEKNGKVSAYLSARYLGTFETKDEAEAAIKKGVKVGRTYRSRGMGCVNYNKGAWQANHYGIYLGRYRTKKEAEESILAQRRRISAK